MNYKLSQCHNFFLKIDKARRTLIVVSSCGDREKRRFEMLQKGISPTGVLLAGVLLLLNRSLRDLVSLRDSFSSKSPKTTEARTSPKTTEARTSPITELVPHRSALTLSAIVSSRPIDSPQVCL
ncbi:hypothetical protein Bca4012_044599 [Brassica carinata]